MSITMTTAPKQQLQEDWDAAVAEFKGSILHTTTHKRLGQGSVTICLVLHYKQTRYFYIILKIKENIHHHECNLFHLQTKSFTRSIKVLFPSVGRHSIMLQEYQQK